MKINYSDNTNFNALFVKKTQVSRLLRNGKYVPQDVSLVKINPKNVGDIWALDTVANNWEYDKFSVNIFNSAYQVYQGAERPKYHIYALTTQRNNLRKLNADKILGLMDLTRFTKREAYISHLQTKPDFVYSTQPKIKGIGTALVNSVKDVCTTIRLTSQPEWSVRRFYKKLGFVPSTEESKTKLIWKKSFDKV